MAVTPHPPTRRQQQRWPLTALAVAIAAVAVTAGCSLASSPSRSSVEPAPSPSPAPTSSVGSLDFQPVESGPAVFKAVTTTPSGATVATGYRSGRHEFGSNVVGDVDDQAADGGDVVVVYAQSGHVWDWVATASGPGRTSGVELVALADDSTIVVGFFQQRVEFSPSRTGELVVLDSDDPVRAPGSAFVARLDRDGHWLWARTVAGSAVTDIKAVAVAADGSLVVVGGFVGQIDFETGPSTIWSSPTPGVFVAGIDENGSWLWASTMTSTSRTRVHAVAAVEDGSWLMAGAASGDVMWSTDAGRSPTAVVDIAPVAGGEELVDQLMVTRVDNQGRWMSSWTMPTEQGGAAHGVAVLEGTTAVVVGEVAGAVTVPSVVWSSTASARRVVIAGLDVDPSASPIDAWLWATDISSWMGTGTVNGFDVVGYGDRVAVTGGFAGTVTVADTRVRSRGGFDVWAAVLDGDGQVRAVTTGGGPGDDVGYDVTVRLVQGRVDAWTVVGSMTAPARFGTVIPAVTGRTGDLSAVAIEVAADGGWREPSGW